MGGRGASSKNARSLRNRLRNANSETNLYSRARNYINSSRVVNGLEMSSRRADQLRDELKKPQYNRTAKDRFAESVTVLKYHLRD